jgi:outer membrane protein TolC
MHAFILALALAAPPSTLDEKIAAALKNHPDIKAAEAKRLLAEAELEQARLVITQKVSAAVSRVELAKAKLMQAEEEAIVAEKVLRLSGASELEKAQYAKARPALLGAKADLAAAELELQQLIGPAVKAEAKPADKTGGSTPDVPTAKLPSGPAMEKLEAAVRMTVKLNFKEMEKQKALEGLLAAVKVDSSSVRGTNLLTASNIAPQSFDLVGEQTFAGWMQLILDECNSQNADNVGSVGVYIREYGLLVERVKNAPKDAITLTEFSQAVRAKQK